ncbi:ABC transporter permease [Streptomyces sp. NPDC127098]|uniref:ABC transporter permease n=1 Tax=Streptomyces sp. NPDC127098 TaxID=3347137 RepID=UPI00366044F9
MTARDLLAAEWIKLWSLRSTRWLLGLGALALIAIAAQSAATTYQQWPGFGPTQRAHYDPMSEAFSGFSVALLMIGAGSVGALAIVGEYATGLIRTTLTAVPARHRVVAAKVTVLAGVSLAAGAVVSLGAFAVSQAVVSGRGVGLSLTDPGVPRVLAAHALLAPVSALVGLGLGALLRHTAAAVVSTCAALVIVPGFFKPSVHQWANELYGLFPYYAWRGTLSLLAPRDSPALPSIADSWLAYALWPLAAAVVAVVVVRRRDV